MRALRAFMWWAPVASYLVNGVYLLAILLLCIPDMSIAY